MTDNNVIALGDTAAFATGDGGLETARAAARSAIELTADQRQFSPQQVAAFKELGIDDAPAAVLDLFFHRCTTTGLDPFNKEIYLIGRKTKTGGYRGEPERWETKWTTQTGIDGYRKNGHKAAKREGNKVRTEGPFWKGENGGGWSEDALFGRDEHGRKILPGVAKYIIWVDGEPFDGIAHYDEFVQTQRNGEPNSMWAKMPANQLAKCAEAQAWRKAYPQDFSGLELDAAPHVIEPDGSPVRVNSERVSAAEVLADGGGVADWKGEEIAAPVDSEAARSGRPVDDNPSAAAEPMSTRAQHVELAKLLEAAGVDDRPRRLAYLSEQFGREVTAWNQLTADEAQGLIEFLQRPVADEPGSVDTDETAGGAE